MDHLGISKLVFLNVMPTVEMREARMHALPPDVTDGERDEAVQEVDEELAGRISRQNAWACEVGAEHERLVPFVGVQAMLGSERAVEEIVVGRNRGAKGVKIQPGMNMFLPTDPVLIDVYETATELGMPILTDSGTYGRPAPSGAPYGQPLNFARVLNAFPSLTLVMAHFASAYWDERIELAARHPNLHFDLSGGFGARDLHARDDHRALPEEDAPRILRKVGVHRFMFGTDGPSVMPQPYIEQVLRLGLTDDEKQAILADNARRIYSL